MPEEYHVRITPRALADLEAVFDYISADSPDNAANMIRRLLDAIDRLSMLPYRHPMARLYGRPDPPTRVMPVRPYLVHYQIDEQRKAVHVVNVQHGARQRS